MSATNVSLIVLLAKDHQLKIAYLVSKENSQKEQLVLFNAQMENMQMNKIENVKFVKLLVLPVQDLH